MKELHNSKGFTLIEIMCVIALLGIISVTSYSIFTGASKTQGKSEEQLEANNIAQAVMEDLLALDLKTNTKDITQLEQDYYDKYGREIKIDCTLAPSDKMPASYNKTHVAKVTPAPPKPPKPAKTAKPAKTDDPNKATDKPGYTAPPPFITVGPDFSDYNAKIEIFDYCDYDFYDIIKCGLVLLYGENVKKDFDDIFSLDTFDKFDTYHNKVKSVINGSKPPKFKEFTSSDAETVLNKCGIDSKRYVWLSPCYRDLAYDDVAYLLDEIMKQYKSHLENCKSALLNVGSFGTRNGYSASDVENIIKETLKAKPKKCYHEERDYTCESNPFETIEWIYKNYLTVIEHNEWWKETKLSDEFKTTEWYNAIDPSWGASNVAGAMANARSFINTHIFQKSGTKTGPYLIMKFYDKQEELLQLNGQKGIIFIGPTEKGSNNQDIYFQIEPNQLVFQKGGLTIPVAAAQDPGAPNPLEVELVKLNRGGYDFYVFGEMSFFVTGGLTYRPTTFGLDGENPGWIYMGGDEPDYPGYIDDDGEIKCTIEFMKKEDGSYFYAAVNERGEYVYDEETGQLVEDSVNGVRVIKESMMNLNFFSNLDYDYINFAKDNDVIIDVPVWSGVNWEPNNGGSWNSVEKLLRDTEYKTLLNLTDFTPSSRPSWFGLNSKPKNNGDAPPKSTNDPPVTVPPDGDDDPGETDDPGDNGGITIDNSGHAIDGCDDDLYKYVVYVYDIDDESELLASLVSYRTGKLEPGSGTADTVDGSMVIGEDGYVSLNPGGSYYIDEFDNAEFVILDDSGNFELRIGGTAVSGFDSGMAEIDSETGDVKKVTISVSGEFEGVISGKEIKVKTLNTTTYPKTEYVFINNSPALSFVPGNICSASEITYR